MNTTIELPQTTLYYREGSSDKVYQCEIKAAGERFLVNFAYGRRGSTLNTGTKTNVPVSFEDAKRIFDKLVKEKKAKGYTEGESGTPYQHSDQQPSGLLPQLLNPIDESQVLDLMNDDNWCMQEKHDGRRLIVQKKGQNIIGINKKGNTIGLSLPLFDVVRGFDADVTIDGESIGDNLIAFDLVELDGVDIRFWPYRERLAALMNLLFSVQQRVIKLVDTAFTTDQKVELVKGLREGKREGIVFKQIFAAYTPGRPNSGGNQLKHKFVATLSALVAKVNKQRSVEISLFGKNVWQTAGNVTIPANQSIPRQGQVVEVRYLYAYRSLPPFNVIVDGLSNDPRWLTKFANGDQGRTIQPFLAQYWPPGKVTEEQREKYIKEVEDKSSIASNQIGLSMIRYIYGESDELTLPREGRRKWSGWEI